MRLRILTRLMLAAVILVPALLAARPASANVFRLILYRRNCETVTAYVVYDSFSVGVRPTYAVFQVDVNGNGVFGEAGEPTRYVRLNEQLRGQSLVSARMSFPAQKEGKTIAVTAYELDSAGNKVSDQLEPVSYVCANKPAFDRLPANTGIVIPGVGVTAKVNVEALSVYSLPSRDSILLGGLGRSQQLNVIARNTRGDWVKIEFQGGAGWIMWQTQALLLGPYQTLPIAEE
jgi:hypothetical protein